MALCPATAASYLTRRCPHIHPAFASRPRHHPAKQLANLNCWQTSLLFRKNHMLCKVSFSQVEVENNTDDEACELVSGMELSIGEGDDTIHAYLLKAVKNNNGTGVLLLSDILGFEDSATRDFAYRVACNGYNVLVPDLFRGDPWMKNRPKALFEAWLAKHTLETVAYNIKTCAKWMMNEFLAAGMSSKKLGIIGFCFGGGRVIDVLAEDQDSCFGIGVSFYGTRIDTSVADKVKVPVLFIAGDEDQSCAVKTIEDIEKRISEKCKVMIFKGRGHGFVHRPGSPEEDEDAERAFIAMRNWLQDGLVAGT